MINIIIRDCGFGGFLPIICDGRGRELYRGERHETREAAWERAKTVWDDGLTGNIVEFKKAHGL